MEKSELNQRATNKTIYVNVNFNALVDEALGGPDRNYVVNYPLSNKRNTSVKIAIQQFNGVDRHVQYTSDQQGNNEITPPFEINQADTLTFVLQDSAAANSKQASACKFNWTSLIESEDIMELASDDINQSVTLKPQPLKQTSETDLTMFVDLQLQQAVEKNQHSYQNFDINWDPRIKIRV